MTDDDIEEAALESAALASAASILQRVRSGHFDCVDGIEIIKQMTDDDAIDALYPLILDKLLFWKMGK